MGNFDVDYARKQARNWGENTNVTKHDLAYALGAACNEIERLRAELEIAHYSLAIWRDERAAHKARNERLRWALKEICGVDYETAEALQSSCIDIAVAALKEDVE